MITCENCGASISGDNKHYMYAGHNLCYKCFITNARKEAKLLGIDETNEENTDSVNNVAVKRKKQKRTEN